MWKKHAIGVLQSKNRSHLVYLSKINNSIWTFSWPGNSDIHILHCSFITSTAQFDQKNLMKSCMIEKYVYKLKGHIKVTIYWIKVNKLSCIKLPQRHWITLYHAGIRTWMVNLLHIITIAKTLNTTKWWQNMGKWNTYLSSKVVNNKRYSLILCIQIYAQN